MANGSVRRKPSRDFHSAVDRHLAVDHQEFHKFDQFVKISAKVEENGDKRNYD